MSRLPALKSHEVTRALLKAGFIEVRQKGSHKIFKKDTRRVIVPFHKGMDIKKGTLAAIIESTGLTFDEFLALLK